MSEISIRIVEPPTDQIAELAKNPINGFRKTAESINKYLKNGQRLYDATKALLTYYDDELLGRVTLWLQKNDQQGLFDTVKSTLERFRRIEQGKTNAYESTEVSVRDELNELGNVIKRSIKAEIDKECYFSHKL